MDARCHNVFTLLGMPFLPIPEIPSPDYKAFERSFPVWASADDLSKMFVVMLEEKSL